MKYCSSLTGRKNSIIARIITPLNGEKKQYGKRISVLLLSLCALFFSPRAIAAQADTIVSDGGQKKAFAEKVERVAIKNNLLYDAAATPNLQLEIRLAPKWSLELGAGFNPFPLDDTKFPKWRHVTASIAPRYWFCNVFNRGFVSVNAAYAMFNVAGNAYPVSWMYKEVKEARYEGNAVMAGASGGWHFPIKHFFSIELEGGVDAGYAWYNQYECKHCGDMKGSGGRWLVLPKLAVNVVFPLGGNELSLAKRCDCERLEEAEDSAPLGESENGEQLEGSQAQSEHMTAEAIAAAPMNPAPIAVPALPVFDIPAPDMRMQRLRSRNLRAEEEYEPYDTSMALSADPRNMFLFFDVDVTKMDRSFLSNDLLMDSIMHILEEAIEDTTIRITHILIVGFASFDASQAYNNKLARNRAKTIKEYMKSNYPQLNDSIFAVENGGESWTELRYGLSQVEFEGRDEVLQIIDTEPNLDIREVKIKKLHGGETYRYMRDELKQILRSLGSITIYCEVESRR